MLAVSPLRNTKDEREREMERLSLGDGDDFLDFSGGNLLDSIDFDDLFAGDVLPDLEMDPEMLNPEMLAEFSLSSGDEDSSEEMNTSSVSVENKADEKVEEKGNFQGEEIVSKRDESVVVNPSRKESEKGRKSSSPQAKNNSQGKRKVKVDWTPELHRRFVQAVEQLGVDKAVPSRILEIMGIDCLTRHNIASHLQKYRSHRKHLLAREAEAASWSQRRQMYGAVVATSGNKKEISPWVAPPTMGFPPMNPLHHFRPLHVWGHPPVDQSLMHTWPKHLAPSISPPPSAWAPILHPPPLRPPPDPSFWHSQHQRVPNPLRPCFPPPPPMAPTRLASTISPIVPGMTLPPPPPPPHAMYKVEPGIGVPAAQTGPHPPLDFHPSKESIDAAIGDVLSQPWLPLPLGLKPPSLDGVMVELQRQGIPKIPPSCA